MTDSTLVWESNKYNKHYTYLLITALKLHCNQKRSGEMSFELIFCHILSASLSIQIGCQGVFHSTTQPPILFPTVTCKEQEKATCETAHWMT